MALSSAVTDSSSASFKLSLQSGQVEAVLHANCSPLPHELITSCPSTGTVALADRATACGNCLA